MSGRKQSSAAFKFSITKSDDLLNSVKEDIIDTTIAKHAVTFEPMADLNQRILDLALHTRLLKIRAVTPEPRLPSESEQKLMVVDIMKRRASAQLDLDPFFLTEVNLKSFPSTTQNFYRNTAKKILESEYPGFKRSGPAPLPDVTTPGTIFEKVLTEFEKANNSPLSKRWKNEFIQAPVHADILQDTFWWFFIELKEKREIEQAAKSDLKRITNEDQDEIISSEKMQLFNRIADNYVTVLTRTESWPDKDSFFWVYPNILSQSVFAAMCLGFSDDVSSFKTDTRTQIVDQLYNWFCGIRPELLFHDKWNFEDILTASTRLKLTRGESHPDLQHQQKKEKKLSAVEQISEDLKKIDKKRTKYKPLIATAAKKIMIGNIMAAPSIDAADLPLPPLAPIHVTKADEVGLPKRAVKFDMYTNSPLVQHYMKVNRIFMKTQYVIADRLESIRKEPGDTSPVPIRSQLSTIVYDMRVSRHNFNIEKRKINKERTQYHKRWRRDIKTIDRMRSHVPDDPSATREISDQLFDMLNSSKTRPSHLALFNDYTERNPALKKVGRLQHQHHHK